MNVKTLRSYKIEVTDDVSVLILIDGNNVEVISNKDSTGEYVFNFSFDLEDEHDIEIVDMICNNIKNENVELFND